MRKKTIGLLLAALMLLAFLWIPASLGGIKESEAAGSYVYNPDLAAAWAANSDNVNNTNGKCATFVKRALAAGGLKDATVSGNSVTDTLVKYIKNNGYGSEYTVSDSTVSKIKPGDVIAIHNSSGIAHVMMVTKVGSSAIWISQRNTNRCNYKITFANLKKYHTYWDGGTKTTFVSMKDTADLTVTMDANGGFYYDGASAGYAGTEMEMGVRYGTAYGIDWDGEYHDYFSFPFSGCLERPGYVFDGWYTEASGGAEVNPSDICNKTADFTLYAHWYADPNYQIVFDANGGNVSPTSKTVTYDSSYGTLPTPTRAGYVFAGWYSAKTGGEKVISSSIVHVNEAWDSEHEYIETSYAVEGYFPEYLLGHSLFAHWTPKSYTVTLNPNGGTCSTGSKTVTYGQAYGTMPVPTRKGYTFAGWWTAKTGGKKVTASTICYASGNYTLYARWTEGYTMTFNPNGGTVSPTTKVVKYGQQYGTLPTPTRAGYTFAGWWTAKTGGKQVTASTVCYASSGYTLYARWTAKKFVITLNPNGGECATKTKTVTYGQAYGTMPVPSPRTGYTFAGWYTAKTGGKKVTATTVCYATGNYTLYARWTPKTYTVTLNPNGGSCSTATKKVTYGQTYGTLPVPTRSGYVFAGWWTAKTGGKQVTATTTCYATGNYTLYARWWQN